MNSLIRLSTTAFTPLFLSLFVILPSSNDELSLAPQQGFLKIVFQNSQK
jgi:hypothetical protein